MTLSPDWGKPKPKLLKERNFHTKAARSHPKQWEMRKWTVKERGGLTSRPASTKLQPPTFLVLQASQTPSLCREKERKKAHATHSHALVGNQEKFICVNRSKREQQNPPAYSQDTLECGMSQNVRGQTRGRGRCIAGECRAEGSAEEGACSKGIFCTEEDGAWVPYWGDNHPYLARPKNKSGTLFFLMARCFWDVNSPGIGRISRFWQ